ncbi:MAG: glutamate synthase subunit beta [Candidatus Omnitrophica bacterium]|nr:glutamate synthase subunit beta [Candidatus Omnitrophota bacterium]
MGELKGFLKTARKTASYRPVCERVKDYSEVGILPEENHSQEQASRCMDCGTPFCHWACPVGNYIPEWNDLVFKKQWQEAYTLLSATNNFPEITGRICPAVCEYSCVLGINDDPVTIRENELSIIEYAFSHGLIKPRYIKEQRGSSIAIVGSGPAGLACADQLNKAGHKVTVFERDNQAGGILRYGIPDFKLEKWILDRRIKLLEKEGIDFRVSVDIGVDYPAKKLKKEFDAVCLACGCRQPRDLKIEGRQLKGIHFAMDYLIQANRRIKGIDFPQDELIDAKGKKVIIIGGGDTGADCLGVAHRQGASCITQIEIMPRPAECRSKDFPWPQYPLILKTSSSHEEGGERQWSVLTKKFNGENNRVRELSCVKVEFGEDVKGCPVIKELHGSEFTIESDLVVLALGFLHPEKKGLLEELGLGLDVRGNVKTGRDFMVSSPGIFSCGDMHWGQSLVVRAISEGRQAAYYIDQYLTGESHLPVI